MTKDRHDDERDMVQRYLVLMVELATRLDFSASIMNGALGLSRPYVREISYFQFRRVCEIIALGCLTLHGDIPDTKAPKIRNEWNADKIMNRLNQLHPHFFPQSMRRVQDGDALEINLNSVPHALTRSEFKKLYNECGQVLHRGTMKSLESETAITDQQYARMVDWQTKLLGLMQEHAVSRRTVSGLYLISLRTPEGPQGSIVNFNQDSRSLSVQTVTVKLTTS
jgi:hypothetical protein